MQRHQQNQEQQGRLPAALLRQNQSPKARVNGTESTLATKMTSRKHTEALLLLHALEPLRTSSLTAVVIAFRA
jgi:hypothetical protein